MSTETPDQTNDEVKDHDAKMVEVYENSQKTNEASTSEKPEEQQKETPSKPEWLPEKFWDAEKGEARTEDLAKSYTGLEQKNPKEGEAEGESDAPDEDAAREAVKDAGLDFDALQGEFTEKGEFSNETYQSLADKGISREIVDAYISGQQALADQFHSDAVSIVGGEENFQKMSEWAQKNLSKEELAAYNNVADQGDMNAVKLALEGINAKYRAAGEDTPDLLDGDATDGNVPTFENWGQVTKAMEDPRYATDPAYREEIAQKLNNFNP